MIPFALRLLFLFVAPLVLVSSISDEEIPNGDPPSAASQMGKAVVSTLALLLLQDLLSRWRGMSNHRGRAAGTKTRRRTRVRLEDIFNEYGPVFFRRAYRMREDSFWRLLDLIEANMGNKGKGKRKRGRTPNGHVSNGIRLAMALRYFAGGDPLDIASVYKVNRSLVYESVWLVIHAINSTKQLDIKFPTKHEEQQNVANDFQARSTAGFNNCAGCLDGILIWIHKPSSVELAKLGIGGKKFFCGRKKKFGLNMQAVCDSRRRFLDVEIRHPGATSDYLAFAVSGLHRKLEGKNPHDERLPFLRPGLALYGDNAYVNTPWMVTPFKASPSGPKDAFNFYHSQVRINIECAFGMLVHRWGILRKAIPMGISLAKTNALVMALCKLHNFCVDENDLKISRPTPDDSVAIADLGGIDLHAFASSTEQGSGDEGEETTYNHETDRIDDLLDGGNHCDDFPQLRRRGVARRATGGAPLPAQVMLQYVEEQGLQRPLGGRRAR